MFPRTIGFIPALALVAACGGPAQTSGPPQLTSGTVSTGPHENETLTQLESQRDRAERRATEAEERLAIQSERHVKVVNALSTRNAFEDLIWSKLDRIDARVKALRAEVRYSSAAQRQRIHDGLASVADKLNAIDEQMRLIHRIPSVEWETFKRDVDRDVNAVARQVEEIGPRR